MCTSSNGLKTSEILIAKGDVPGAYTKFPWDKNSSLLMCNRISKDFIYIPTNGNFGTSSAPAIFDCIMRPVDELLQKLFTLDRDITVNKITLITPQLLFPSIEWSSQTPNVLTPNPPTPSQTKHPHSQEDFNCNFTLPKGRIITNVHRIVDDYIEFSRADCALASHELVKHVLESYFGSGKGWKRSKDLPPDKVQIVSGIGLDLSGEVGYVFLPDNHFNKLLRSLFLFSLDRAHSIKEYQALGSLLNRASIMIQCLSSYLSGIYLMIAKFDGAHMSTHVNTYDTPKYKHPNSLCKMCIQMARTICLWMFVDPTMAAMPIHSVLSKTDIPFSYKGYSDAGTNIPYTQGLKQSANACVEKTVLASLFKPLQVKK